MSACRRHYPGRFDGRDSLMTAPSTSAFPRLQIGRLLHYQFRGLLSVHSCYNLRTHQVALCDPLHRRLRRLCCLHRRSDCYRVERSSSRAGSFTPLWTSAFSRRTTIASVNGGDTTSFWRYNGAAKEAGMRYILFSVFILASTIFVSAQGPCTEAVVKQGTLPMADDAFSYMPEFGKAVRGKAAI